MRGLIDKEKPPSDIWDFKLIPGGLSTSNSSRNICALIAPARGTSLPSSGTSTADVLQALGPALIASADLETVLEALTLFTDLSQIIRLCIDGDFDLKEHRPG